MEAPVIETARLRLRGHRLDDLAPRIALTADPATMHFIGGPQGREENWRRIQRSAGQWALLGWGLFALEREGHLVGEAGLSRFERGLGPDFDDAPEAAWMISSVVAGLGFASEAMSAAIDWHVARFGPVRMVCIINPENRPSLRLAERLSFIPFREARYNERSVLLFERLPLASPDQAR